ncbi:uroporphyrinogen-III synthase [Tistlia consotensis]|uniref:Uroporphyrinogen-III synthase n=1 Tax=Tistlia consotensis USBA 355 TaxID=560819 RepID=A0A1Y6CQQ4_9PROT|nr:uroporphyrinogen-III synthase [Tistlia consotensis]SMF83779.1 uroporphyrinogen-III synthase [Tistlia consotensis USBA 355]SNS34384.1 uroporphyrinogen-III synthase [Tistlia consotensis]
MRLLLTRPQEDAERSAERLRALGHRVELEPLLTIRQRPEALDPARDLEGVQALVVTSLNGLRAFLAASPRRDLPVFAVGPASAGEALAAGFRSVRSGEGDAAALAELVAGTLDPAAGALLHPAGTVTAGALAERLGAAGFALRRVVLYEAVTADRLGERTEELLRAHVLDGALFYSPRTATTFVSLVRQAGLEACCATLTAWCLSPAVAAALAPLGWRRVAIATTPREAALFRAIEADTNREIGSEEMSDEDKAADTEAETGGESEAPAGDSAAELLIARFGGLRPMASKLGIAVSTVQGWKSRGHIPPTRTDEIRKAAAGHGIALDEAELAAATAEPGGAEGTAAEVPLEGEEVDGPGPWVGDDASLPENGPGDGEPAATPAPTPRPAPARRGGSRAGAWLGGGALGVLLVAAGAAGAVLTQPYWQPYLDSALPGFDQRVEARLKPLQERLQALESAPKADGSTLSDQLGQLQDRVSGLADRLSELSDQVAAAPTGGGSGPDLAALQQRVDQLESQGGSQPAALDDLKQQVAKVQDALAASGADPQALEGFRNDVAKLSARFDDLNSTIEQVRQGLAKVDVVQGDLADLKSRLGQLADQLDQLGSQRLAALQKQVEANAQALQQSSDARNRGALLALALGQLREALRFSEPYRQELQGVEAVAAGPGAGAELAGLIQPLKAGADAGVPNLTALRRQFAGLAPEIVGATYGSGEQGWLADLLDRVPELVTVRPVGQATGDSVGAKVARAERALGDGDLPAAVKEIESLDGKPAAVAKPWLEAARARLAADKALAELTRRAITELSGGAQDGAQDGAKSGKGS